jgi:hypothetical protein
VIIGASIGDDYQSDRVGPMRQFLLVILVVSALGTSAHSAESIVPGVQLSEAVRTLARHGYEVNSEKFGLAIASTDKSENLEFCRVDDGVTLVLACDRESKRVKSLQLYFIGDGPKSTRSFVVREVLKMSFDGDSYTVTLRRQRPSPD